jgi:hypothetical protein
MQKDIIQRKFLSIMARAVDFGEGLKKEVTTMFFVDKLCEKIDSIAIRIDIIFISNKLNIDEFNELSYYFVDEYKDTLNLLFSEYKKINTTNITNTMSKIKL